jgi:hypothetical protein
MESDADTDAEPGIAFDILIIGGEVAGTAEV